MIRNSISVLGMAAICALGLAASPAFAQNAGAMGRINADANGDGAITRAEAMAAAQARFQRADGNGDGRLSEADRPLVQAQRNGAMFGVMDSNSDGTISRSEWDAAFRAREARMAERRAQRGDRMAQRGQGGAERRRGPDGPGGEGMRGVRRADANNDGSIDRAEFMSAAERRFARGDANGDGTLSAAEIAAQREQRGGRGSRR